MQDRTRPARGAVAELPERLARIAEERDWTALEVLCDQHILAVEGELAGRLLSVLGQLPEEELRARPRLMIAWISAYHAANQPHGAELRPHLRHFAELGTRLAATMDIANETSIATLVTVGSAAMIGLRLQGACDEAEKLGQRLTTRAAQLSPLPGAEVVLRPASAWLTLQRGLTRSLMDDFPAAVELYRQAYEQTPGESLTEATSVNATANLAMIFGYLGHGALARQWLDRMGDVESPSQRVRFLLTVGGTTAEGWDALDRYDEARLASCLEITGDGTKQLEVWPFVAALVFAHGLYLGDPAASLAHLGALRLSHAPALVEQRTAARVLRRAHVELLIATGQATRALHVVKDVQAPWLALPAARLRLLNGEYEAVRAMASRTSWHETTSRRDARQMLLLKAIAALRMGDKDEARQSVELVGRVRTPDDVLSLASLSPADRDDLCRLVDLPLTDEAAERLARARPVFPDRVELVELTNREQVVLTELDAGLTIAEVARKLVVSVNTVRTQVKSAYRKLGAVSREGALMRAYELGVLQRVP